MGENQSENMEEMESIFDVVEPTEGSFVDHAAATFKREKIAVFFAQSTPGGFAPVKKILMDPEYLKGRLIPTLQRALELYEDEFEKIEVSEEEVEEVEQR